MAKQENRRSIYVYAHWVGIAEPFMMGILHSERLRGKEIFSSVNIVVKHLIINYIF